MPVAMTQGTEGMADTDAELPPSVVVVIRTTGVQSGIRFENYLSSTVNGRAA